MKKYCKLFCICGILGWCLEILFTSIHSIKRHNHQLTGTTSLFMFPIYGMAMLIAPFSRLLSRLSLPFRGLFYGCGIMSMEYFSGSFLMKHHCCPWNYCSSRWNIRNVIRLDYLPLWMLLGILYERIGRNYLKKS